MVYRGKPSPGCALCRTRRLKCDRRRPSCSQCLRIKKECSGYQDVNALRFFDQTKVVTTKAKACATVGPKAASSAIVVAERALTRPITSLVLPTSIQEQALSYSLKYYVGTSQSRGALECLPQLLRTDPSDALQSALKAVGLASMSRTHDFPGLKRSAGEHYSLALRATNQNLRDTVSATSDSTLAAVILLGLCEIIACHESDMLGGWVNHVQGATKLLELRGLEQLKSPAGVELFTIVRMQIAMSNMFFRTKWHTSPAIATLSRHALTLEKNHSEGIEAFYHIIIPLNDLSIEIQDAYDRDGFRDDTAPLIAKVLRLDADLASWAISLGPSWHYTIAHKSSPFPNGKLPFAPHSDEYHVYPSISAATLWNHYRHARIVLHEMLRPMCSSMLEREKMPEAHHLIRRSMAVNTQMVGDICASVPFFFASDEGRFAGASRLPWPLFVAADCTDAWPYTKNWICQVLNTLASSTGIQQARIMASLIKGGHHGLTLIPGKSQNV